MAKPDTVHELQKTRKGYVYYIGHRDRLVTVFEDLSLLLPLDASIAGMTLTFEQPIGDPDPVYLKDKYGHILAQWEHTPSLSEVREVSQKYL